MSINVLNNAPKLRVFTDKYKHIYIIEYLTLFVLGIITYGKLSGSTSLSFSWKSSTPVRPMMRRLLLS